jgi:hypothetical protein
LITKLQEARREEGTVGRREEKREWRRRRERRGEEGVERERYLNKFVV